MWLGSGRSQIRNSMILENTARDEKIPRPS
jgi:hypothetical protein